MLTRLVAVLAAAACLAMGGCDETDLGSVQVDVKPDLSGRLALVRIVEAEQMAPGAAAGVEWEGTAGVVASTGGFKDLSKVRIADIQISAGRSEDGMCFAKVTIPRGAGVAWPGLFLGASEESVKKAGATLIDAKAAQKIGRTMKLTLRVPSNVVSQGLAANLRGVDGSREKAEATLVVPLDCGREAGAPIVWHVTWEAPK